MKIKLLLNYWHQLLGKSNLAVRLAVLLRNQAQCVIKYHLNETADPEQNGEVSLIRLVASTSSTFIDVGANVGNWTQIFLEIIPELKQGLLLEPSEAALTRLKKQFNHLEKLEIIPVAVSDTEGEMTFYEEPNSGECSSLVPGFSNSQAEKRTVKVTTIDRIVESYQLDYVDFLKIDTEGYDLHVIRGASKLLQQQKIGFIQFEYNSPWSQAGSTLAQALSLLESFQYQVFLIKSSGLFKLNYELYGEYLTYSNFVGVAPARIAQISSLIQGTI